MRLLQTTQRELHQTVVMVTHDLDMARQTQRILQISDGVIAADAGRSSRTSINFWPPWH